MILWGSAHNTITRKPVEPTGGPVSPDPTLTAAYAKFVDSHTKPAIEHEATATEKAIERPAITAGILQSVSVKDIIAFAKNGTIPATLNLTENSLKALKDHAPTMLAFAQRTGATELFFTKDTKDLEGGDKYGLRDGTWVIPPQMADNSPEYKQYLLKNYNPKEVVGTASLVLAVNQTIPQFDAQGKQIGGFENGDAHGYLVIVDRKTGRTFELHQTFMEDSNEDEMRPDIIAVNEKLAAKLQAKLDKDSPGTTVNDLIKASVTKLNGVGMILGPGKSMTGLLAYLCELIESPDDAKNWNNKILGANFNYVPLGAFEFKLTEQQLQMALLNRALAARECAIMPARESKTRDQNHPDFIPHKEPCFYMNVDGTRGVERWTRKLITIKDGEEDTAWENLTKEEAAKINAEIDKLPEEEQANHQRGIRVHTVRTVLDAKAKGADGKPLMQVVRRYNDYGSSADGFEDSDNCFSAVGYILGIVAAHGNAFTNFLSTLKIKNVHPQDILWMIRGHLSGQTPKSIPVKGNVAGGIADGEVLVYDIKSGDQSFQYHDYANLKAALREILKTLRSARGTVELAKGVVADIKEDGAVSVGRILEYIQGLSKKLVDTITEQRQHSLEEGVRKRADNPLLLPVGTAGNYMKQTHNTLYGPVANQNGLNTAEQTRLTSIIDAAVAQFGNLKQGLPDSTEAAFVGLLQMIAARVHSGDPKEAEAAVKAAVASIISQVKPRDPTLCTQQVSKAITDMMEDLGKAQKPKVAVAAAAEVTTRSKTAMQVSDFVASQSSQLRYLPGPDAARIARQTLAWSQAQRARAAAEHGKA